MQSGTFWSGVSATASSFWNDVEQFFGSVGRTVANAVSDAWHGIFGPILVDLNGTGVHTVDIAHVGTRLVEHGTAEEANATLDAAVAEIGRMQASIEAFHGEVATPLGLASRTRT